MYNVEAFGGPLFKEGGIMIKKENRGKFTESANRANMGVQEYARHILANKEDYSPTLIKRANFARNFGGHKHTDGGYVEGKTYDLSLSEIKQLEALKQGEFFLKVGANEAIKIKTTDKFINMEIDEGKHQEHIAYQLEHYYTKIEDENIIEYGVVDSKPLAPIKSF